MAKDKSTSTRLNANIRGAVLESVSKSITDSHLEGLLKAQSALADMIYDEIYTKSEREAMAKLPNHFFNGASGVNIKAYAPQTINSSGTHYLDAQGNKAHYADVKFSDGKAKPRANWDGYDSNNKFKPSAKLQKAVNKVHADNVSFTQNLEAAMRNVQVALQSVTTVGKLLEVWPEAKDHLPILDSGCSVALMIRPEDINSSIAKALGS